MFQGKDGFVAKGPAIKSYGNHWKQKLVKIIRLMLLNRQWSCTLCVLIYLISMNYTVLESGSSATLKSGEHLRPLQLGKLSS